MRSDFPLYTTDYISGVMSLRKPQDGGVGGDNKKIPDVVLGIQIGDKGPHQPGFAYPSSQGAEGISQNPGGNRKQCAAAQGYESECGPGRRPRYVSHLLRFRAGVSLPDLRPGYWGRQNPADGGLYRLSVYPAHSSLLNLSML